MRISPHVTCLCALMFLWVSTPFTALASPIIADISNRKIEIYSGFTGTQLLLFGARNDSGDIVLVVRGPEHRVMVRKKERRAGIWVNRHQDKFDHVPLYFALASSRPLEELQSKALTSNLQIYDSADTHHNPFREALHRILTLRNLYHLTPQPITFMGSTLFKASFTFPDNMPRGIYTAEIYLFSDGQLAGAQSIPITVVKTGFDAFLYDSAMHHGFWYGAVSILIALCLGWAANWLFKRI